MGKKLSNPPPAKIPEQTSEPLHANALPLVLDVNARSVQIMKIGNTNEEEALKEVEVLATELQLMTKAEREALFIIALREKDPTLDGANNPSQVIEYLIASQFRPPGPELCKQLIESKLYSACVQDLAAVPAELHTKLAKVCLDDYGERELASKLSEFVDLDPEIAKELIKRGFSKEVVEQQGSFKELETKTIISYIFECSETARGHLSAFQNNLVQVASQLLSSIPSEVERSQIFAEEIKKDLNHPFFWQIIDPEREEKWGVVVIDAILSQGELTPNNNYQLRERLSAFEILPARIAETFVHELTLAHAVVDNPSQFTNLTEAVGLGLINYKIRLPVLATPEIFGGSTNNLAEALIEQVGPQVLSGYLDKWVGLSSEIALKMIERDYNTAFDMLANLKSFDPLGHEHAIALAKHGVEELIDNLHNFQNLDRQSLAQQLLLHANSEDLIIKFLEHRHEFSEVRDEDIIDGIIKSNCYQTYNQNIRKQVSDKVISTLLLAIDPDKHQSLASTLINIDQTRVFLNQYNKFQNTDFTVIAQMLLDSNVSSDLRAIANQIDFFPPEKHQEIAKKLVIDNQGILLLENWDTFQSLNKQEIFDLMMDPEKQLPEWKYPEAVAKNLDKFLELDHNEIVAKYIQTDQELALRNHISLLKDLSLETSEWLITAGRADVVCSAPQSFPELNQRELVFYLIGKGDGRAVLVNLANLDQVSFPDILEKVFESLQFAVDSEKASWWEGLQIANFRDYPRQVSLALSETNRLPGKYTIALSDPTNIINAHRNNYIDDFPADEVARHFITQKHAITLFRDHCSFKNDFIVDQEFIDQLIATGQTSVFLDESDARFEPFYTEDNLKKILDSKRETVDLDVILKNKAKFVGLTNERLIELVIERNLGYQILFNLEYFDSIPMEATVVLAKEVQNFYIALNRNEEKFQIEAQKIQASKLGIRLSDYLLVEDLCNNKDRLQEEDYQKIYQRLSSISASWKEEASLPFKEAAEQFGYKVMFAYINRTDISHHDACFALVDIKNLLNKVNQDAGYQLSNKQLGNLLLQVSQDDATYPEGTALHHLNSLANRGLEGPQTLKQKVLADIDLAKYENLQERLDGFASRSQTLASWRELKVYSEWNQLIVHQAPSLKKVSQLREAGQVKLADYFETIAFYPGSKVNCEALFEFVEDPRTFLARSDLHAPVALHNDKKPSNYLAIPHLGLTAEEVRDALVEGKLDRIQVLPASETIYSFANPGLILETDLKTLPIAELLLKTLGSRKTEVEGMLPKRILSQQAAAIQKIIYSAHQSEVREGGVKISDVVLDGYQPSEETVAKVREHLLEVLRAEKLIDTKPNRFLAKVHLKSSPDAVLAGDDTACCMPFGSGKNNIYMLNPNCVQFTIQQLDVEGKATRTVAQSVLTLNFDAEIPFPDLRDSFSSGEKLSKIVPENSLNHSKRVIVCDSIETNKNFTAQPAAIAQLKLIYEDFFKSYLEQLPEPLQDGHQVDKSQVRIGTQYAGPFASAYTLLSNTHVPLAPMSYSDNTYANSYYLTLERHLVTKEDQLTVPIVNPEEQTQQSRQVSPLTYRDCLMTAYLEGKIYSDNPSLMVSLHTIQNVLIAHDIAKAHREQPDLSFKYQDTTGKMKAYLIAYQGEHQSVVEEESLAEQKKAEPCIYIYDFAATNTNGVAGGKVLLNFLEQYQQEYLQTGNPLPIYIDARERTSYKLLMNQIKSFEKRLGCKINIEHLGEEMRGAEIMKKIKITPQLAPVT